MQLRYHAGGHNWKYDVWYPSTISVSCHTQPLFLCCMFAFSVFVLCFMLVCFVSYFLILQLATFLLSCCMKAVALFLLFNESVIVHVLNFYESFMQTFL